MRLAAVVPPFRRPDHFRENQEPRSRQEQNASRTLLDAVLSLAVFDQRIIAFQTPPQAANQLFHLGLRLGFSPAGRGLALITNVESSLLENFDGLMRICGIVWRNSGRRQDEGPGG